MEPTEPTPLLSLPSPPTQNLQILLNNVFQDLVAQHPTFSIDQVFYLEAARLHLQFIQKKKAVETAQVEIRQLRQKLGIEAGQRKRLSANQGSQSANENGSDKKKRSRRTAVEIARHYICTIDKCNKSYGSEGSLNQHIKMKHGGEYGRNVMLMELGRSCSQ